MGACPMEPVRACPPLDAERVLADWVSAAPSGVALVLSCVDDWLEARFGELVTSLVVASGAMTGPPPPPAAEMAESCSCPVVSAVTATPASAATPAASAPTRLALRRSQRPSRRSSTATGMRSVGASARGSFTAGNSCVMPSRRSRSATVNCSPPSPCRELTSSLRTFTAPSFVTNSNILNRRYQFVVNIVGTVTALRDNFRRSVMNR